MPFAHVKLDRAVVAAVLVKKEIPERPEAITVHGEHGNALWDLLRSCWSWNWDERPAASFINKAVNRMFRSSDLLQALISSTDGCDRA